MLTTIHRCIRYALTVVNCVAGQYRCQPYHRPSTLHSGMPQRDYTSHILMYWCFIPGTFRWVKFLLSGHMKAYFRGLIFVVCPEHVIIQCSRLVAYCLDFRGLVFCFGRKINPMKISPLYTVLRIPHPIVHPPHSHILKVPFENSGGSGIVYIWLGSNTNQEEAIHAEQMGRTMFEVSPRHLPYSGYISSV